MAVDHKRRRVAWAHDGYGKEVLDLFFRQPTDEQRTSIKAVTGDGAKWIDASVKERLPNAERVLDSFHIVSRMSDAPDQVGNLTNREKTILVKQISEAQSVSVKSLLPVVGLAHSTYHYRLNAMRRPDRDAWLLPLVEGRSRTARSATATSACTWNCRAWG